MITIGAVGGVIFLAGLVGFGLMYLYARSMRDGE